MGKLITLAVLGLMFSSNGLAGQIPLENLCPSEQGGKIISFFAQDCYVLPCNFVRGRSYKAELTFIPGRNSSRENIRCGSVVLGQPQIIADWNACDELTKDNRCPITGGQTYTYSTLVAISPYAPPGPYTVHCELVDDGGVKQLCVQGDVRILPW